MASPDSRALDVIVREFTHAVTQAESDLTYINESDGMNEAMSDIMATYCESWSRTWVVDSKTWRVGEDVWTPATANDALRCATPRGSFRRPGGLVLDLVRHEVAGRILFHPGHFTVTCQPDGATQLRLVEPRTRREQHLDIRCDGENAWTFRSAVFPGAYVSNLFVSGHYPNGKVFVELPALEVSGPRPELVLSTAPDATTVSGTLTRSGQQIGLPSTCGYVLRWTNSPLHWLYTLPYVVLVDTHDGSRWKLPIRCGDLATGDTQWTFSGRAPGRTYRVELELDHTRRRETPVQDSQLVVFVPGPVDVIIPRLKLSAGD